MEHRRIQRVYNAYSMRQVRCLKQAARTKALHPWVMDQLDKCKEVIKRDTRFLIEQNPNIKNLVNEVATKVKTIYYQGLQEEQYLMDLK